MIRKFIGLPTISFPCNRASHCLINSAIMYFDTFYHSPIDNYLICCNIQLVIIIIVL